MAITPEQRRRLYDDLTRAIGPESTEALMDSLPPPDTSRLADKDDVALLRSDHEALKSELKADVGSLKADVGSLKADVGSLKVDVGSLKVDVETLQADMAELKSGMSQLTSEFSEFRLEMATFRASSLEFQHNTRTDIDRIYAQIRTMNGVFIAGFMGLLAAIIAQIVWG